MIAHNTQTRAHQKSTASGALQGGARLLPITTSRDRFTISSIITMEICFTFQGRKFVHQEACCLHPALRILVSLIAPDSWTARVLSQSLQLLRAVGALQLQRAVGARKRLAKLQAAEHLQISPRLRRKYDVGLRCCCRQRDVKWRHSCGALRHVGHRGLPLAIGARGHGQPGGFRDACAWGCWSAPVPPVPLWAGPLLQNKF